MAVRPFSHELISLPSGLTLEATLSFPADVPAATPSINNKLAVCLHPWSWLGGRMDDPVLHAVKEPFLDTGHFVLRYNSRGVGRSSGWPSFTGAREAEDLRELVEWATARIPNVKTVVILGYSHGALIASLLPILPEPIHTSHILLSYPLGPRSWLTAFRGQTYTEALVSLLNHPKSNVLIIYGDQDEFTGVESYDNWADSLRKETEGHSIGRLEIVKVEGGTHFWIGETGRQVVEVIRRWL